MAEQPYTSAWWLERLGKELDAKAGRVKRLRDYYEGRQPLALATEKYKSAFLAVFGSWSDNFCALVVQAVEERLTVQGFEFGSERANKSAWSIWQANEMDAQSQLAHREALITAEAPVIVWPGAEPGTVDVRIQPAEEVAIGYADDRLRRAVALRRWVDPAKNRLATLYYPDRIEKYAWWDGRANGQFAGAAHWVIREVPGEPWPLPHDLGAVPVVALVNDPGIDGRGRSEIADVIPLQDALNKLFMDLLVASEYGAFRQRWATGIEIPVDPETSKPLEPFKPAVDRIWSTPVTDAKFGDFEQTQLTGITSAIETTIQHIASTSRTPPHYLLGQMGTFPSGEALRTVESGLVAKARRRQRDYGEGWEDIMRLAFRAVGKAAQGRFTEAETNWADPENRTESQHIDALTKLRALNVPDQQLWADAGYTPQQISRFQTMTAPRPAAEPAIDEPEPVPVKEA